MDWYSRKVLGWRLSNTMEVGLCLDALGMAVRQAGRLPEVFNTDQGSQFTSQEWTGELTQLGIAISMDGKGRWMDNVFIERLWRSVKHEALGNRTPSEAHAAAETPASTLAKEELAA